MTSLEMDEAATTAPLESEFDNSSARHFSLPPTDRGIAAWRLLTVAFTFELLLWGFPLSFGVFQEYYSRLPLFRDNPLIGVVGTVASGMSYIGAPLAIPLVSRHPHYRRHMIWIGWPLCLCGLVAGSFAQTLELLILTQGVTYGLGFITFYYPILSMVNEYWIERRGLAYAIMCSASGFSGAVMPFVTQALLEKYGYAITLRIIAVSLFVLTGPLIPILKGRTPEAAVSTITTTDWSFLRNPRFWIYSLSNLAMGMGYFFPSLYLPSYAVSNGLSPTQGALLLAVMSVSQALGLFSFGYMSDKRMPLDVLTVTSPLVAALAVYTCWGLASTLPVMLVFAMIYGFFGSGYTATWARIGTSVSSDPIAAFAAFGTLNLGKGLGNVLTGPIGGALVEGQVKTGAYGAMKYEKVVLFTGSCMLLSGATILLYRVKHSQLSKVVLNIVEQHIRQGQ